MEQLNWLYSNYSLHKGEVQWIILLVLSVGIVVSSLFWQLRLGKKGVTQARSMLTLLSIGYPIIVYLSRDLFLVETFNDGAFFFLCIAHVIVAFLLKRLYDIGRKRIRVFFCFVYSALFAIGFFMVIFAYYVLGAEFAERHNQQFEKLSQKEKNEYYTHDQLCERTGIADWPSFDVATFKHTVCGPDEDFEIVLRFHKPLSKTQIDNMENLCERGKWLRIDDGYRKIGTDKEEEGVERWGFAVYLNPQKRTLTIRDGSD